MSWDYVPGKNAEGYPDPTAAAALSNVQRSQRGLQSKRAGEHFENMIAASLGWYKDKGVAFIEKTPEPMRPLRPPNRQGQFLACYIKAGQPDFKGTLTGGRAVVFEAKHTDSDRIDYNRLTQGAAEQPRRARPPRRCRLYPCERRASRLLPGAVGRVAGYAETVRA